MRQGGLPLRKDQRVLFVYMLVCLVFILVLEIIQYGTGPTTSITGDTHLLTRLFQDIRFPLILFAVVFNLSLSVLIFKLRFLSEKTQLTMSQRWALTILGWLFLLNSIQISIFFVRNLGVDVIGIDMFNFLCKLEFNVVVLTYLPLLTFGLIYPRPMMKWRHTRKVLVAIGVFWLFFIIIQSTVLGLNAVRFLDGFQPLLKLLYLPVCFIPIFLWLPEYSKQDSPQMRMILTILIWGYLFYILSFEGGWVIGAAILETFYDIGLIVVVLCALVFILLIKTLYLRRKRWATAEWTNVVLMTLSITSATILALILQEWQFRDVPVGENQVHAAVFLITSLGGWMLIRPILFSYGMLRYQFFGPGVKAGGSFRFFFTILGIGAVFLTVAYALGQMHVALGVLIGVVCAGFLLIPIHRISKKVVVMVLPMSEGSESTPLSERRATYLMGLQTAVVEGDVGSEYDDEALENLREELKVSDREHDLLMDGFAREKPAIAKEELEEAYLFHKDGALLCYSGQTGRRGRGGKAGMGTMVSTVSNFSRDAMIMGSDRVESIEYGNVTLIVEIEEDVALGVILRGKDSPQVRAQMRDVLNTVQTDHSRAIKNYMDRGTWQRTQSTAAGVKGLQGLLNRFLAEGGA